MNSNEASTSNISNFLKPKKRRLVFFVLALSLIIFFSFQIPHASAWTPTETERNQLKTTWGATDEQIDQALKEHPNVQNLITLQTYLPQFAEAASQTSVNQFSPSALGGEIGNWFASKVWDVVIGVLAILAYFCKVLLMFGGKAMDATLNPNLYYFTNNPLVTGGWIIVRDVCNLFFLLALLFIAICTILKIDKYHAKKTLLTLIIMALLINFSKPIAIFIFDGSQLLMNMFLSEMTKTGQGSPSAKLAADIAEFIYSQLTTELNTQSGSMQIAVYYLFIVVFLFMFAVALFVTALFLIIRIVAVMVLIIVSPLAFFAAIIPDFSKMSSSWWSALFKYCYYGPAAAFFLFLATKFALGTAGSVLPHLNVQGETNVISHLILYLTVLVFLYASIIMSQQFGLFAANAIVGNANKFMKWAGGVSKGRGMWGSMGRGVAWGAKTTGATGAVTQRLQQSKLGRLLTKSGREEALEEREAAIAEKIGVKGAKARQLQKRAKKYKDEHYSKDALEAMVARGDEAAGYRLAEDGDLDEAAYAKLALKFKGKDDPVKKLIDGKLKDKRMDVLVNYRINTEATTGGVVDSVKAEQIAEEEFGKLSPSKWKDQNIEKMTGYDPTAKIYATDPTSAARRNAAKKVYTGFNTKNKDKATDDMTGAKYAAGDGIIW